MRAGARAQTLDAFTPAIASGQDQHGNRVAGRTPVAQQLEAVAARQAEVEDDRIVGLGRAEMARVDAVGGKIHRVTFTNEAIAKPGPQLRVVFGNQQSHRVTSSCG